MAWKLVNPNITNDPSYLEPRISNDETNISSNATQLAQNMSKLTDMIKSVKEFGVKGDGTTDDTVAIQAALDYSNTNKCYVYFPLGKYLVKNTLTLGDDTYIIGSMDGQARTTDPNLNTASTHSPCKIVFTPTDTTIPLFKGKTGITGGMMICKNIEFTTSFNYYPESYNTNTFMYGYNCNMSHFENVQWSHFTYVFSNLAFQFGSRLAHCYMRYIGGAAFYQASIIDSHIYNNYFNGMSNPCASFCLNCTGITTSLVVNNWFEFFKFVFHVDTTKSPSLEGCLIEANFFDYCYRVFDAVGIDYIIVGNTYSHSNITWASATNYPWILDSAAMADNDWVSIKVQGGYSGITITGNMGRHVNRLIELIGDASGALKEVSTFGNQIDTKTSTTPYTDDKIVRVSVGQSSWLGSSHMTNMRISELDNWNYSSPPTTGLVPGRKVFINSQHCYLDTKYVWRRISDGSIYGYNAANLVPIYNATNWTYNGTYWTPSNNGYTLTATGYSGTGFDSARALIPSSGGKTYRFNTNTSYYSSNGTTKNGIELHFLDNTSTEIAGTAIYVNQLNGYFIFTTPANTANIQVKLNNNYAAGVTFTYNNVIITPFTNPDYGTIRTDSTGKQYMTYVNTSGTLVVEPYV
jgi:hypothetical protein